MNEYTKKTVKLILAGIAALVCLALVIAGHSMGFMADIRQGMIGLGIQLVGLAGILVLLCLYNKPYTK